MQFFTPLPEVQTGMPQTANALRDMTQGAQYRNDMAFRREQAGAENKRAENYLRLAQDREGRLAKSETAQEGRETTKFGWEEKDREVKQALQQMDMITRVAGSVSDQGSHEQAVAQLQQMKVDTSKIPSQFDPKWWKRQGELAITAADRIKREWEKEDIATKHKGAMELQGAQDSGAMARTQATIQGQKDIAGLKLRDPDQAEANYIKAYDQARQQATDSMGTVDQEKLESTLQTLLGGMGRGTTQPVQGGAAKQGGWKDHLSPETKAAMQGGKPGPAAPVQPAQPGSAPPTQPIQPVQAAPQDRQNALKASAPNLMDQQRGSYTAPNGKVVNWEDIKDTAQKMWSMTGIDQAANAVWKGLGFVGDASIDFVKWLAAQQAEQRKQLPAYRGQ